MRHWIQYLVLGIALGLQALQASPERDLQALKPHELEARFAHHARLQDENACLAILERFDALTTEALKGLLNVDEKARKLDITGYLAEEMMSAYLASDLDSATVQDRLEELTRCYPRRE
ncbi:MAG: hypothetical protein R3242_02765 [Akkermansiaceae bacterium]|nr:hypothetical protein [Akkermansiaceae bacterium]